MVHLRPAWTVAGWLEEQGHRGSARCGGWKWGVEARSQGWESQGRWLKHQHNKFFFFFPSLFIYQQQLWYDINNPSRNLENWLGLNGGRSSRKGGRRTHSSSLLHQPPWLRLTAPYCSLPGMVTERKAHFSEWKKRLGWNVVIKKRWWFIAFL